MREDGPDVHSRGIILDAVEELMGDASWEIPDDFMEKTHFERCVKKLDWTSSPGYPYMRGHTTNSGLFEVECGIPSVRAVDKMWDLVQCQIRDRASDPIRLFIKAEPHKLKKLETGKYRLISSVSVVDQLIDHMLFGDMNEQMISNWNKIPPKVGWSQVSGGWRFMPKEKWMALDKSSWDWTVNAWLCEMTLSLRARLCKNVNEQWLDLAKWRYKQLFLEPTFITSGGLVLRQLKPGIMKSGCVNTITDNSIMQLLIHVRASYELGIDVEPLFCMGDDTLQRRGERWAEYCELVGQYAIVKQVVESNDFAGFRFLGRRVEPLYRGKHSFNLLHLDESILSSISDSYQLLYHRSAYKSVINDIFFLLGEEVLDQGKLDRIFDGF